MSSMSLKITAAAVRILGSLNTQSKASFVMISPIPMKDQVVSMQELEVTSATSIYSSIVGMYPSWAHFASVIGGIFRAELNANY